MKTFSEIQQIVNDELKKIDFSKAPRGLYEPIEYELGVGGKRLRPSFALFTCQLFSGDYAAAVHPAVALEVFHNYTLMHDDIMDKADKRRNKPTVHKVWNENTAILSGDAMMGMAYQLLEQCDEKVFKSVFDIFSETAMGVFEGQQYDMNFEVRSNVSIDEYMTMIRLKTAVLLAASFKIGAVCGGASQEDAEALYNFGINVGLSFQLCDDLLDVYGDTAKFGKNIGGDICDNKKTYLYIKALQLADGSADEELLRRWFRVEEFDKNRKIAEVTEAYNRLNVKKDTEDEMERLYGEAGKALDSSSLSDEQKSSLMQLAGQLISRDA